MMPIDFLALEQLAGLRHREPCLAGAGGADAEYQFVALERADVGILRGGACAHRALAQVDFLELRFRRLGIELEQRALRDHGTDRTLDIALRDVLTAHRLLVEHFEYAPGGIAAIARSGDGDVITA